MHIGVIGGGAAGFFAAVTAAADGRNKVTILEKSSKILSKVRISGGGRCNVTHDCRDPLQLVDYYPRGKKELRNAFARFSVNDTIAWFEKRGVRIKSENDGRMFPDTDNSATIINCLLQEASSLNVKIIYNFHVASIEKKESFFEVLSKDNGMHFDRVVVTAGGNPSVESYRWLLATGHSIIPPVPSLFTFNIYNSPLKGLEGIACDAVIMLKGSRQKEEGPVLITHWGLSGPAVIRLSAWAARDLHALTYNTEVYINWLPAKSSQSLHEHFLSMKMHHGAKKVTANSFFNLPHRLWERLCMLSGVKAEDNYADLNKSVTGKLVSHLVEMTLLLKGKTTYKEEFVTCGGISLKEVDMQTMQSKKTQGLFFAGEILDIDGITGGFNFQAAWTTGFLAGKNAVIP